MAVWLFTDMFLYVNIWADWSADARHPIPVIGLIGNDACWSQIAREQIAVLH